MVGEGGIGKSRLRREFETTMQARAQPVELFRGRADPQTASQPYGLLRDIVARRLQIADDDTMAAAKAKLEGGLVPLPDADDGDALDEAQVHLLGHLIGLDYRDSPHVSGIRDEARQIRQRAFHAAAGWLRRTSSAAAAGAAAARRPALGRRGVARFPAAAGAGERRPADADARPGAAGAARAPRRLAGTGRRAPHRPRAPAARRQPPLAAELLKRLPSPPDALLALVTGGAEGNPFYMEELVRMLVDEGAIETGADGWTLHADRLAALHVPATLSGVLQARLDALAPDEKRALQQASVIGVVFWDQALAAIDAAAPRALPGIWCRRRGSCRCRSQDAPASDGVRSLRLPAPDPPTRSPPTHS